MWQESGGAVTAMSKLGVAIVTGAMALVLGACGSSMNVKQGAEELSISEGDYINALSHQDDGDYFEAIESWKAVIDDEPEWALAHFNLGVLYDRLNMMPEATECYEIAVNIADEKKLSPDYAVYNLHLGAAYLRSGLTTESLAALKLAEQGDQFNPAVHYNLAACYMMMKNYDTAVLHADLAVDLTAQPGAQNETNLAPDVDRTRLTKYLMRQAECHIHRGEFEKAEIAIKRIRTQCKEEVPAGLWDLLNKQRKAAEAEKAAAEGSNG